MDFNEMPFSADISIDSLHEALKPYSCASLPPIMSVVETMQPNVDIDGLIGELGSGIAAAISSSGLQESCLGTSFVAS